MSVIRPFRPFRPRADLADVVSAPPYDVVSLPEARRLVQDNEFSFLRVSRAELELPDGTDPYDPAVYRRGAAKLESLIEAGILCREADVVLGVYRQQMGDHVQTGLVGLASVREYDHGAIKRHELTRPTKEDDRVRLLDSHDSQSGPVFLTYCQTPVLAAWFAKATSGPPEFDFAVDRSEGDAKQAVRHTGWIVSDEAAIAEAVRGFSEVDALYIADGHHRSAAASRVARQRRRDRGAANDANWGFLSVIFPDVDMQILPYNRVVKDLNGLSPAALLDGVASNYHLEATDHPGDPPKGGFDIYLGGVWRRATPKPGRLDSQDQVARLAVSLLSDLVLEPLLGIADQRTSARIDFIGGIRGVEALEARVDSGTWAVALWLDPTTVSELLAVADSGQVMPPKSTWFEPKLRDGLFIHDLEGPGRVTS